MPIPPEIQDELLGANPPIEVAHDILIAEGYRFMGYHGTSMAALRSIVPYFFDETRMGTGSGLAKGPGFYLGWQYALANDHADSATQAGDPPLGSLVPPRFLGNRGIPRVLRMYARNFEGMELGKDYTWGVQSSDGDPNGDLGVESNLGIAYANLGHDLELVFRRQAYKNLAAIPAGDPELEAALGKPDWGDAHTYMGKNPFDFEKTPLKRCKSK